jgi:hypothetical protein
MTEYTPPEILTNIAKIKFKRTMVPIGIVIIGLILQQGYHLASARYLSIIALIYYLLLLLIFRINRTTSRPERGTLISPINGKVKEIRNDDYEQVIIIKKNFYHPADIRLSALADVSSEIDTGNNASQWLKKSKLTFTNGEEKVSWSIRGSSIYFFPEARRIKGGLTAILPGSGICTYRLSDQYRLNINTGDKLEAGTSIIGSRE